MEELEEQLLIKSYLLGALTEPQQEQIEQRVFTDPLFKARVLMVEDELVEDYVAGLLSESERESFRSHFLSTPAQIQKFRIAKALYTYSNGDAMANVAEPVGQPQAEPLRKNRFVSLFGERPIIALLSVSAAFVVVIVAALYITVWRGDASRRATLEQEVAQLNNRQDPQTGLPPGIDPASAGVITARLSPNLNRSSGEMTRISVPAETTIVQIRLPLTAEAYPAYQATLSAIEGDEIFTLASLPTMMVDGKPTLVLNVPARALVRGDYLLKLRGVAEKGNLADAVEYPFRVTR